MQPGAGGAAPPRRAAAGAADLPELAAGAALDRIALSACRLQGGIRRHLTPLTRRASDHLPIFADLIAEPVAAASTSDEAARRGCRLSAP